MEKGLHVQQWWAEVKLFFPKNNKFHACFGDSWGCDLLGRAWLSHVEQTQGRRTQRRTLSRSISALGMRTRPEMVVSGPLKIAAANAPTLAPPVGQVWSDSDGLLDKILRNPWMSLTCRWVSDRKGVVNLWISEWQIRWATAHRGIFVGAFEATASRLDVVTYFQR